MSLETKPCAACGKPATQVIHAETETRRGWYCPACGSFETAIGRERMVK